MRKKIAKVFPWYYAFDADLLFYIAIDTLFLGIAKDLTASQIVSISTIGTFSCILLQFPILWIIKRIGNTASVRVGATFLLLSAIALTFGPNYYVIALGWIFHEIAMVFRSASEVALENCLDEEDSRDQFVKVRTKGNTIYSIITMIISFVASFMFNLNNYFPMICCIIGTVIGFILSFFIVDYTKYNKIIAKKEKKKVKINFAGFILLAILVYGLFYPIVTEGQSTGKLFIQSELLETLSENNTSIIIGIVVALSRIVRVISNLLFAKVYTLFRDKIGVLLTILLGSSIALQLFGSFIPPLWLRITVMSVGYLIVLFIRDPFRIYVQDVIFDLTEKEAHQTLITLMQFSVKVGTTALTFISSMILLEMPMWVAFAFTLVLALIEIILGFRLYYLIRKHKIEKAI